MNLKLLVAVLILGVVAVAVPVTVRLSQQQTQLKSQAAECPEAGQSGTITNKCGGGPSYDICVDEVGIPYNDPRFCQNPSMKFRCASSVNPNCMSGTSINDFNLSCSQCPASANGGGGGGRSGGNTGSAFTCRPITTNPSGSAPLGSQVTINAGGSVTNYPNTSMSRIEVWIKAPNQSGFTKVGSPISCSGSEESCGGSVTWNTSNINNGPGTYTIAEALVNTSGGSINDDRNISSCNVTYTITPAGGGGASGAGSQATGSVTSISPNTVTLKDSTTWNNITVNYDLANSGGTGKLFVHNGPPCAKETCGNLNWTPFSDSLTDGNNKSFTWTSPPVSIINVRIQDSPATRTIGLFTGDFVNGPIKLVAVKDVVFNAASGGGGGGGTGADSPPTNGDPPAAGASEGSTCTGFAILDKNGKNVTRESIHDNETYTFRLTLKNEKDTPWVKSTYKLKAIGETTQNWTTPEEVEMPKDRVAKGDSVTFTYDVTTNVLPAGKTFEIRNYYYGMAGANGPFGAACEPEIQVNKKPVGPITTKCYVLSDKSEDLTVITGCDFTNPKVHKYSENPLSYPLSNVSAGPKAIYVRFFDNNGNASPALGSAPYTKALTLSPAATVSSVTCSYNSNGPGTQFIINGSNLGNSGTVKVGEKVAQIPSGGWTPIGINATLDQRLEGNTRLTITPDGGSAVTADCTVNTTTFTFTVKNQCREDGLFSGNDLDVKVYEAGEEPIFNQKVKLDAEGKPSGFAPKLEKGKNYTLVTKAVGTLAKKKEFKTGSGGTTNLESFTLPVGDIAPRNAPDGVINNLDTSELKRQWAITGTTSTKTGDFNDDAAVNSLDWSCVRLNFNARDEKFSPPVGATPAPSNGNAGVGSTSPGGSQIATQTNLTLSADTTSPRLNSKLVFRGTLKDNAGNPIANKSIKLLNSTGDTFIKDSASDGDGSHPTDTNGSYIIVVTVSTLDQFRAYAKFEGDSNLATSQSQVVSITPRPADDE